MQLIYSTETTANVTASLYTHAYTLQYFLVTHSSTIFSMYKHAKLKTTFSIHTISYTVVKKKKKLL